MGILRTQTKARLKWINSWKRTRLPHPTPTKLSATRGMSSRFTDGSSWVLVKELRLSYHKKGFNKESTMVTKNYVVRRKSYDLLKIPLW